jgi:molecular chaperone GrpE (heat shock protein)
VIGVVIIAVRLESEVKELRKDLESLTDELRRRDTYVETVRQRSELDVITKQVSALWSFVNNLRDRFNGK